MTAHRADIIRKKLSLIAVSIAACSTLLLAGCDNSNKNSQDTAESGQTSKDSGSATTPDLSVFAGCYTVSHDEPAQIKISEQNGSWVMQMKEPASANRVWDTPEPLEIVNNNEISSYFSIDPDNVDAVIARPDRVLVMAHVKPVYANIDPLLDSEYLSYIYKGANTIYRVECDDVNIDILANPHANIKIDKVSATTEL